MISPEAWQPIEYTDAVFDEQAPWISRAEVAEIGFTAFVSRKRPSRCPAAWFPAYPT